MIAADKVGAVSELLNISDAVAVDEEHGDAVVFDACVEREVIGGGLFDGAMNDPTVGVEDHFGLVDGINSEKVFVEHGMHLPVSMFGEILAPSVQLVNGLSSNSKSSPLSAHASNNLCRILILKLVSLIVLTYKSLAIFSPPLSPCL